MPRTIAISDIHGCLAALDKLLELIDPQPQDTLVGIGDYVDRGPQSRGVLERLMALERADPACPAAGQPRRDDAGGVRGAGGPGGRLARLWRRGDLGLLWRRGAGGGGPRVPRPPRFHPPLPLVLRDRPAFFRPRQLRGRTPLGPTAAGGVAVEVAEVWSAGAPLLGQDGHRRPHRAAKRRGPRLRLPQVHRHLVLRRRLAYRPGAGNGPPLAGGQRGRG